MTALSNPFGARSTLSDAEWTATYYSLRALEKAGLTSLDRLPFTVKVLLENVLRNIETGKATEADVEGLGRWNSQHPSNDEFPFMPARVLMQDLTGVPAVVDLAAMRSAVARMGGDPQRINPLVPADLVIDHSVQVDYFGSALSAAHNVVREYERNRERYLLLRWAQKAFHNFRVVPPGTGIVHQVNIEYLARVVQMRPQGGELIAFPDTLVGTDSHTTMVNAMGVLGWGVGGIEAEAVLLGQPLYLLAPEVLGFRFHGQLPEGATATDLVLVVTQVLRQHGVVGRFVEFYGPGLSQLSSPTGRRCPTWPRNMGPRPRCSRWTRKRCSTSVAPGAAKTWCRSSSATPRNKGCSAPTSRPTRSLARCSSSTCLRWSRAWPDRSARRIG